MTKTLTEQWRDGTLPEGYYYFQYGKCAPFIKDSYTAEELKRCIDAENIKALAGVPTYAEFMDLMSNIEYIDKYKELLRKTDKLEKRLKIATKALEDLELANDIRICMKAQGTLKEMEGVK